jgi:hypothetical protein
MFQYLSSVKEYLWRSNLLYRDFQPRLGFLSCILDIRQTKTNMKLEIIFANLIFNYSFM